MMTEAEKIRDAFEQGMKAYTRTCTIADAEFEARMIKVRINGDKANGVWASAMGIIVAGQAIDLLSLS